MVIKSMKEKGWKLYNYLNNDLNNGCFPVKNNANNNKLEGTLIIYMAAKII